MNKENLQRMADYIRTVPQEMFSMQDYRTGQEVEPECDSVGCVIGHCTVLDKDNIEDYRLGSGLIYFTQWSNDFTDVNSLEWKWCFGYEWSKIDDTSTGAANRIEWLIKNGLPENWYAQMKGNAPLCYL